MTTYIGSPTNAVKAIGEDIRSRVLQTEGMASAKNSPTEENLILVDRLEKLREREKWSEREVSKRAGLSPTHYGLLVKKGGTDRLSTIKALAEAFNVDLEYLAGLQTEQRRGARAKTRGPLDVPAEEFFAKLQHHRSFVAFIHKHTAKWLLSDIVAAFYLPHETDESGTPVEGWPSLLDRAKAVNAESVAADRRLASDPPPPPSDQVQRAGRAVQGRRRVPASQRRAG
jgi:transcriptional regulator with XRE-family HTH domain